MSFLKEFGPEKAFWVNVSAFKTIGKARSLEELLDILVIAPVEVFQHHINEHKNDFAEWIGEVVGDNYLSRILHDIKHLNPFDVQLNTINVLKSRISYLHGERHA